MQIYSKYYSMYLKKLTALSKYACIDCMPLVNGCISDALLNAAMQNYAKRLAGAVATYCSDVK